MKKLTLFTTIILLSVSQLATAQDDVYQSNKQPNNKLEKSKKTEKNVPEKKAVNPAFCRKAYIGFSLGVNNPGGIIGFDLDIPILKNVSIGAGAGSSTWGTKVYIDGKYYLKPCHRGWAFGVGITHNTGENNFTANLETIYQTESVTLNLNPQTNMFIGAYYFWTIGRRYNRFYAEAGYSVPFSTYSYSEIYGDPLDNVGERTVKILSPGGLMIGAGFSFGVH
jgi:hypothetical protein